MNFSHKLLTGLALAACCLLFTQNTASAQATSQTVPWSATEFVACANGGEGEFVQLSGELHMVINTVVDGNGCTRIIQHVNAVKITGVGQTTGDVYRATGGGSAVIQDFTTCEETCEVLIKHVDNYRVIGPGKGNNFTIHQVHEEKVNICTGEFTLISEKLSIDCK